jgi:hypothetical protein
MTGVHQTEAPGEKLPGVLTNRCIIRKNHMREVPDKYKKMQKEWKLYEVLWSLVHFSLGIAAAILAFLAGAKDAAKVIQVDNASMLAVASGVVAAVLTFLSPASRRKAYTEACNILRVMRLRFENQDELTNKELNDAIEKAQDIVAKR